MRRARTLPSPYHLLFGALGAYSGSAWGHAFDERYDLPAPLSYFVAGATAAVGLSFVVAALVMRGAPSAARGGREFSLGPVVRMLPVLHVLARMLAVLLLGVTIAAGLFGTRDPVMNLAPTLVWIVGWVGLSLFAACVANVWAALDPWRAIFDALDAAARRLGRSKGIVIGWRYPRVLDAWPAVALLLFIGWFEVAYPEGAEPGRIAIALLAWSFITLLGMACFGRDAWQRNADVFAVYFATLGRFAPLDAGRDRRTVVVRPPGHGLITDHATSLAMVAFVIAMLATVLFDGLLSGEAWWVAQARVMRAMPQLANPRGALAGAVGLVVLWLLLLAAYVVSCWSAARLAGVRPARGLVRAFAFSLVPIAVGYLVAHNFSNLLVQGQHIIALVSDPFGRQWNLFGTAGYRTRIGIVDARITWYVAIGAIVAGHVVSIWIAHRVALRELGARSTAALACIPLTVLMLACTAVSLAIIAEPMVKFETPGEAPASSPDAALERSVLQRYPSRVRSMALARSLRGCVQAGRLLLRPATSLRPPPAM